jgi:hypothetical protein
MKFSQFAVIGGLSAVVLGANNSTLTTATPSVSSHCSFSKFTATVTQDIQKVVACTDVVGDIHISGPDLGAIDLTGVQAIYGDLSIDNAIKAVTINAPDLELVAGEFEITNATILSTLNLAKLTTVGTLQFTTLPALGQIGLTSGLTSAESVIISDTSITSLEGINVFKLKVFNINNNGEIDVIHSGLQKVTSGLTITDNNPSVNVTLDKLASTNDLTLGKIGSLSAANLTTVNGSLSVIDTSVEDLEFKKLTSIGKSLTIDTNDDLDSIDFPKLTSVGGALEIGQNDDLENFGGFPELETVGGTVNMTGSFNNGSFPSLKRVAGGFIIDSKDGELTCSSFDKLNSGGIIRGNLFSCSGADGASSSSSSKSGSSNGVVSESGSASSTASESASKKNDGSVAAAGKLTAMMAGFAAFGVALF